MLNPDILIQRSKGEFINYAKIEFNKRIERLNKADEYFKSPNITELDIERTEGTLLLIVDELAKISYEIEKLTGEKITTEIAVNGFEGV